jgi:hypothetical protein
MKFPITSVMGIAALSSLAIAVPAAASATSPPAMTVGQSVLVSTATAPGTVGGVDVATAEQNGYTVHALQDGTQVIYSSAALAAGRAKLGMSSAAWSAQLTSSIAPEAVVPASGHTADTAQLPSAVASPDIGSGCGQSYVTIYLFYGQNGKYQEETGFEDAIPPAVGYTWSENIAVFHEGGSELEDYNVNQSGALALDSSWTGQHTATNTHTPLLINVSAAGTWFLSDGLECYAYPSGSGVIPPE